MAAQEKQYRPFLWVKEGVKPDAETVNVRLEPDRNKGGNTKESLVGDIGTSLISMNTLRNFSIIDHSRY